MEKEFKIKVDHDTTAAWAVALFVLFYDFNGQYDLYDALLHWLMR